MWNYLTSQVIFTNVFHTSNDIFLKIGFYHVLRNRELHWFANFFIALLLLRRAIHPDSIKFSLNAREDEQKTEFFSESFAGMNFSEELARIIF